MAEFDQTKYVNQWAKENMGRVSASYKAEFVSEFKEACKTLGVTQSEVIRIMMSETIKKAKDKG